MSRAVLVFVALAGLAASDAEAQAPQTATDPDSGAAFTYVAGLVTVDLTNAPKREVGTWTTVQFVCLTQIEQFNGGPVDLEDPPVATAETMWPAGQTQLTATLSRALASADVCGLERDGGEDLAWAAFTPAGKFGAPGIAGRRTAVRRLAVADKVARRDATARASRAFARPRALVRIIRRRPPGWSARAETATSRSPARGLRLTDEYPWHPASRLLHLGR